MILFDIIVTHTLARSLLGFLFICSVGSLVFVQIILDAPLVLVAFLLLVPVILGLDLGEKTFILQ